MKKNAKTTQNRKTNTAATENGDTSFKYTNHPEKYRKVYKVLLALVNAYGKTREENGENATITRKTKQALINKLVYTIEEIDMFDTRLEVQKIFSI